jgi:predicted alpha/beta superfamily hydrolase
LEQLDLSVIPGAALTPWVDYPTGGEHTVIGTVKMSAVAYGPTGEARSLLVYLPPSYAAGVRRYPTLYMHDGQNLFDAATSFSGEWQVDETLEALSAEGIEAIVVGIPNAGPGRSNDYTPFPHHRLGGGGAAAYVQFLTGVVKPLIDQSFRTAPDRAHTGTAGSSLGGLVSLYALLAAPEVFGFAGVFSPAFWWTERAIFSFAREAPFTRGRIYMDVGDEETPNIPGLREAYVRDARRMAALLRAKGYGPRDLRFVVEAGGRHNEAAWARRLPGALRFLLGPLTPSGAP